MKRFQRQGEQPSERDAFSKPLPESGEERKIYEPSNEEREEQAETIFREQESEEGEIDWDKKRQETLEKRKVEIAREKMDEFRERHNRLPEGNEEDEIAKSIFGQLQREEEQLKEEEGRQRKRGAPVAEREMKRGETRGFAGRRQAIREPKTQEVAEPESDFGKSEMIDLLKEEQSWQKTKKKSGRKGGDESEEGNNLQELEEIGNEGETEESAGSGKEAGLKNCPKCGNPAEQTVFCPGCGAEFCDNCAKPQTVAGKKKYKCPSCGFDFTKSI